MSNHTRNLSLTSPPLTPSLPPCLSDCLPEIKSRIQAMTMEVARELDALGEPTTELSFSCHARRLPRKKTHPSFPPSLP